MALGESPTNDREGLGQSISCLCYSHWMTLRRGTMPHQASRHRSETKLHLSETTRGTPLEFMSSLQAARNCGRPPGRGKGLTRSGLKRVRAGLRGTPQSGEDKNRNLDGRPSYTPEKACKFRSQSSKEAPHETIPGDLSAANPAKPDTAADFNGPLGDDFMGILWRARRHGDTRARSITRGVTRQDGREI